MERLFTEPHYRYSGIVNRDFTSAKNEIISNYGRALMYYQKTTTPSINNTDVLSRLIYQLPDIDHSSATLQRNIKRTLDTIAAAVGITTPLNRGYINVGTLYNQNTFYISQDYTLGPLRASHYKRYSPLRVLTHTHTALDYRLATDIPVKKGIAIIGIDIVMFAIMFKGWHEDNIRLSPGQRETNNQFISKWILPSLFESFLDCVVRNRLIALADDPQQRFMVKPRAPFFTADMSSLLTKGLHFTLNTLRKKEMDLQHTLTQVPMIFSSNYYTAVPINVTPLISNSYWVGIIVYTSWLTLLLSKSISVIPTGTVENKLKSVDRYVRGQRINSIIPPIARTFHVDNYNKLIKWVK